jgi:ubiquinone/menaquinone biosynthesis C-methylase UbiE
MPTIEENKAKWGGSYDWPQSGDEWSNEWGGVNMQWYGMLLPRIHKFLNVQTILEIAPGYGRWTQFLKNFCEHLILIDVSPTCVDKCKSRFIDDSHIKYFVNDGKSLDQVEDRIVDFLFCFDSLVHAEDDVIESYIAEISKKLSHDGVAFLHHSNLGEYHFQLKVSRVPLLRVILRIFGLLEKNFHLRGASVTAKKVVKFSEKHNLVCISQELLPWKTKSIYLDCLSVIVRKDSKWCRDYAVYKNCSFMEDAKKLRQLSFLYEMNF